MCLSPCRLPDGTLVACRHCRLCHDNRINDLVGRCIAEQSTAFKTFAVTLTYGGGDTPESVALRYADVQLFLKRLRKAGHKVRYIVAGEYGTKKGRAHWHGVLFFYGSAPDVPSDTRIDWEFWPHGYSYFQEPDYKGFRYVMKYALKDDGVDGYGKALAMSKRPPLGHMFFMELADDLVERGLPVHSPEYAFAHVRDRHGKARRYWLQGRMREMFFDRYQTMWRLIRGGEPPLPEWLVEHYFDKIERARNEADFAKLEADIDARRPKHVRIEPNPEWMLADSEAEAQRLRRKSLGYLFVHSGRDSGLVVAFEDEADFSLGDKEWTLRKDDADNAGRLLLRLGVSKSAVTPVCQWLAEKWHLVPPGYKV